MASRVGSLPIPQTGTANREAGHWQDRRHRPLRDLRDGPLQLPLPLLHA